MSNWIVAAIWAVFVPAFIMGWVSAVKDTDRKWPVVMMWLFTVVIVVANVEYFL